MLDWDNGEMSTRELVYNGCAFIWCSIIQFNTDLGLYQQCHVLQKILEIKDFSRLLSDFPVLFKAYLIFKDF